MPSNLKLPRCVAWQADPKNITLHYTVGMLYQLAGRPQEVCDHLYEAYMLAPGQTDPQLLFHLANNLKAIGENEAAVNFYAMAIGGMIHTSPFCSIGML